MKKLAEPDISVAPGLPECAAAQNPVQRGKVEGIQLPTYEETGEQLAIPVSVGRTENWGQGLEVLG